MPGAVVLAAFGRLYKVDLPDRRVDRLSDDPDRRELSSPRVSAADETARRLLERLGLEPLSPSIAELRAARSLLPSEPFASQRAGLIERARRDLAVALSKPVETLVALAREEERVERALNRELGAADQWIHGGSGPLAEYAATWKGFQEAVRDHHRRLEARLAEAAERAVPNLSRLVGPKVAGRLVAAAGGIEALGRMNASRLQLLGSRRRRGGERGPKFGVIAAAVTVPEVPISRRGAFARSLASWASVAARADATTRGPVVEALLAKRERRIARLAASGGRP